MYIQFLLDNNLFLALEYVNQMVMEEEILAAVEKVLEQHYGWINLRIWTVSLIHAETELEK